MNRTDYRQAAAPLTFTGDSGDNSFTGDSGDDSFFLQQGGNDTAVGMDGNDGFFFGGALTSLDVVDGGAGTDTVALQGNYAGGVALGNITNVDVLLLASGADTQFGDTADNRYSYWVTTQDLNVAAGQVLTIQATGLLPTENLTFDGTAETNGGFRLYPGQGVDYLRGGAGSDGFFFGADNNMTSADHVDGGAGVDSIALRGNYVGANAIVFQNSSFTNIEVLAILSSHTHEYGGAISASGYDYDIRMADGNVAAGQRLDVIAGLLGADETLTFDGSAELDGSFRVIAGAGDDHVVGGRGDDLLYGQNGRDWLEAGAGEDLLDGGEGDDTLVFRDQLDAGDRADGAGGYDTLWIGGRDYDDTAFAGVSHFENVILTTAGQTYRFGAEAQRAGLSVIIDYSLGGGNVIDASGYSDFFPLVIQGGPGADIITGGTGFQEVFAYTAQLDSFGATRDVIYGFDPGHDLIDTRLMFIGNPELSGRQVALVGNFDSEATAELYLPGDPRLLSAVFVTGTHTLWFDINEDRQLNDSDLSIVLVGVNALQPHDVNGQVY